MHHSIKTVIYILALPLITTTLNHCAQVAINTSKDITITKPGRLNWSHLEGNWKPMVEWQTDDYIFAVGRNWATFQDTKAFIIPRNPNGADKEYNYIVHTPERHVFFFNKHFGGFSSDGSKAFFAEYGSDQGGYAWETIETNVTILNMQTKGRSDYRFDSKKFPPTGIMAISCDGKFCAQLDNQNTPDRFATLRVSRLNPHQKLQTVYVLSLIRGGILEAHDMYFTEDGKILIRDKNKRILDHALISEIIVAAHHLP